MRATLKQLILLLLPLLSLTAKAQQASGVQLVQMLLADEQVRLVHSQPYYAAGERLWFKAFINKSSSTKPPSRALYVELYNAQKQPILRQRLVIENNMAFGDMLLPEDLPTGNYTLVAATNWMKNFSGAQQFREELLIVNAAEVLALRGKTSAATDNRQLRAQFYPEANSLVAGVPTKVAVVATNAAGVGVATSGTVVNKAGETVASFQTNETGTAVFNLKPTPQEQYEAQLQANSDLSQNMPLPQARQSGLALAVVEQNSKGVKVMVHNNASWHFTLVAEAGGKVYFAQRGSTSGTVTIPWQAKPGEAVRILLLNPGGLAEAEQKVVRPQDEISINVSTAQQQYGPHQVVKVTLHASGKHENAVAANLAVAVTETKSDFIRPLSLDPTVWGKPGQDGLALVHAADEELWGNLVLGKPEVKYKPETLIDAFAREDVAEPFVSANYRKATDTAFVEALPESVVSYALQHRNRERINGAYGLTEPHAIAPVPKLPADRIYALDDYVTFENVEEAIRETTTNLRLSKKKGRHIVRLLYVRPGVKRMMKGEPIYLIDGVVVKGMEEIMALDLNDIASFELAWMEESLHAGNLGFVAENGMFAVYTKSGNAREKLKEKGCPLLFEQYNRSKAFVPASSKESINSAPDFRQVLHWEPQLQLDADGTASFSFFTSDETGTFVIKVQGQTAEGVPIKGEAEFQVNLMK